jgi:hypothetical protein
MRLLNYLVYNMPDGAWLSGSAPPGGSQGLSRRASPGTATIATATVSVNAGKSMAEVTPSVVKRQDPLACTTTITVSPTTTVYSINSLTSTYTGPASSATPSPVRQPLISLCSKLCSVDLWGIMYSSRLCVAVRYHRSYHVRFQGQAQSRLAINVTTLIIINQCFIVPQSLAIDYVRTVPFVSCYNSPILGRNCGCEL